MKSESRCPCRGGSFPGRLPPGTDAGKLLLNVGIVLEDAEVPEYRLLRPRLGGRMLGGVKFTEDPLFKCPEQLLPEGMFEYPRRRALLRIARKVRSETQKLDNRSLQKAPF